MELLIALILTATLMVAVWSLSSLYLDFFQSGEERTQEAQLLRSLAQQLTEDLTCAIQDPIGGGARQSGAMSARRFGLSGTANSLRVDVLQESPVDPAAEVPDPAAERLGERTPQVPELKTIFYSFRDPYTPSDELLPTRPEDKPGLVRRELDFETPVETPLPGSSDQIEVPIPVADSEGMESTASSAVGAFPYGESLDGSMPEVLEDEVMYAPEVMGLVFRYFDGRAWRPSWNSLAQKGLPVAVEMSIQLGSLEKAALLTRSAEVSQDANQQLSEVELVEVTELETVKPPPVHRVVVYLPGSPLRRVPQRRPATARERIDRQAEPRPVPRVTFEPRVRPATPTFSPDQWMRSNP